MIKKLDDLTYICTNLGNLAGIPVRLFEKQREIFYYSPLPFTKDPFELEKEHALCLNDGICYYQAAYSYYYGIINVEDKKIVVGPTRQLPITPQELNAIAFSLGVIKADRDEFFTQMKSLVSLPLMSLLQILCMVYFALTGEKKTIDHIAIHETEQNLIQQEMEKTNVEKTMDSVEESTKEVYHALDIENQLMDMVMRGDVAALKEYMSHIPTIRSGAVAKEQLRQSKNIFIVAATLISRAAIRGGVDVTAALALSDSYIQRCEITNDSDKITELSYHMLLDYAERVAKLRLGYNPSALVVKVSNYVQQHLSDAIKVEDIAKALFMGRSRLSTNFKIKTGKTITDYILSIKIDEAKRLLRYSDKSFTAISVYLGFSSQSHFSKVFKQCTEVTPFEYRQLHKHF